LTVFKLRAPTRSGACPETLAQSQYKRPRHFNDCFQIGSQPV
jgi:hypothetical protein